MPKERLSINQLLSILAIACGVSGVKVFDTNVLILGIFAAKSLPLPAPLAA
jgi:hypothetical protein